MSASPSQSEQSSAAEAVQAIDLLLDELADLAETEISRHDYYRELLDRAVFAVSAKASAVWMVGPGDELVLAHHSQAGSLYPNASHARYRKHRARLNEELSRGTPHAIVIEGDGQSSMVAAPISIVDRPAGMLVLYVDGSLNEAVKRAFQPFVDALAELAVDFERNRRVRGHDEEMAAWRALHAYSVEVHQSLNIKETGYAIANEGRVFLDCDRVSVFAANGRKMRILASSGLANLDTRSNYIRRLATLAARVARTRETFFYHDSAVDVPRRLRSAVDDYLAESKGEFLGVIPLGVSPSARRNQSGGRGKPTGAIVVEMLKPTDATELIRRCQLITDHAETAFHQCRQYQSIPLRPVWMFIRWCYSLFGIRKLPRTLIVVGLIVAAVLPLVLIKTDFEIEVRGELRPVTEQHVFAPMDGFVDKLLVEHGQDVSASDILAELRAPDLEKEIAKLSGEIRQTRKKIDGLGVALNQANPNDPTTALLQSQIAAEIDELNEQVANLVQERALLESRRDELKVPSPIDGQVVTWEAETLLRNRPVRRGESLVKVADVAGEWHLELEIPDRKIGYVLDARNEAEEALSIQYVLETDPDLKLAGSLATVSTAAHALPGQPATVDATATIDKNEISQLRPGASVVGRIDCGKRSLGYVWLHDMIDAVHRRFFW